MLNTGDAEAFAGFIPVAGAAIRPRSLAPCCAVGAVGSDQFQLFEEHISMCQSLFYVTSPIQIWSRRGSSSVMCMMV